MYRLDNRSAPEWVIDPCQVSADKHCATASDSSHPDNPEHIVHVISQLIARAVILGAIAASTLAGAQTLPLPERATNAPSV